MLLQFHRLCFILFTPGIIDDPDESLFTYNFEESWAFFYDPFYTPSFTPSFNDPELEELAVEICGDSLFCLFDIAATKRPEVGMTTAVDNEQYDVVVNMSQPGELMWVSRVSD